MQNRLNKLTPETNTTTTEERNRIFYFENGHQDTKKWKTFFILMLLDSCHCLEYWTEHNACTHLHDMEMAVPVFQKKLFQKQNRKQLPEC